ncbi:hypothetical protein [Streptomyces flavalbus]|uniref:Uncharacterized protein n=1 Tax=Streptomyces flavalbus TaxID=2665155 RepID=A0ABW2W3J2_9ACTN
MRIRRTLRQPPPVEPRLPAHVTATVWGPAEFVGLPPWRLAAKGLVTGVLGASAIVGAGLAGAWTGVPLLGSGEAACWPWPYSACVWRCSGPGGR